MNEQEIIIGNKRKDIEGEEHEESEKRRCFQQPCETCVNHNALADAVNSVTDYGICLLNSNGLIQNWNRGAQLLTGYGCEEILQKHISILYTNEEREAKCPDFELQEALRSGQFEDEEWRIKKDGNLFWALVSITPIISPQTKAHVGFCKIFRDMTHRKNTEAQLKVLEKGVDCVVDYAIFMLDPTGHILTWNKGAERIKGYSASEVMGKHFSMFYAPDNPSSCTEVLQKALREGSFQDEAWRMRKGGQKFWASVIITAVHNEHGVHIGFCKVTRDLTEQRRTQERLIQLQKEKEFQQFLSQEAERLRKKQSNFIDRICHEIRNPLNGILGTVKLLQLELPDVAKLAMQDSAQSHVWIKFLERLDEAMSGIKECAEHQKKIADEVLTASKMDGYNLKLDNRPTNPKDVVQLVGSMFRSSCAAKGLQLLVNTPKEDYVVSMDAFRLQEVLVNLLSNSLKFTTAGQINVGLEYKLANPNTVQIRIIVEDTGIGMTSLELGNLFQQFAQTSSNYNDYPGTGLGLWITKQIIELMKGSITAESTKNVGSKFIIDLECPVATPRAENPQVVLTQIDNATTEDFGSKKILIVEDNKINQKILSAMLKHIGISAQVASNGQEAVTMTNSQNFDLIFMDILMPVMNGIEATELILKKDNTIPIVGVSGFGQDKDKQTALGAGMRDYITKPYHLEDLWRIISTFLKSKKTEMQS